MLVENDVFSICERIKEIDPNLKVILLEWDEKVDTRGHTAICSCPACKPYAIMETSDDGVERLVCKVRELDERVLTELRRMIAIPFAKRFEELEKIEAAAKAAEEERQFEELYERMGGPMWKELEKCGFIDGPRAASYAKGGLRGRRR
jgi:hypothetical protein